MRTQPLKTTAVRNERTFISIWILFLSLVILCNFSVRVSSQVKIPATIDLKPAFVGSRYELMLPSLLPAGTGPTRWNFVAVGPATDGTALEIPTGVTIVDIVDSAGNITGGKLVVAPTAADLQLDAAGRPRTKPFAFEVRGTDYSSNQTTIRFTLPIKPFGIDESRIQSISGSVANFIPAHDRPAGPVAPDPFVLTTSTADEETVQLSEVFPAKPNPPTQEADTSPDNVARLQTLIDGTVGATKDPAGTPTHTEEVAKFKAGDYLLMHVIDWDDQQKADQKVEPRREVWALFKSKDKLNDSTRVEWEPQPDAENNKVFHTRIFGGKRVAVLLIHLNTPPTWDIKYKIELDQKIPTPFQNVLALASSVAPTGGAGETKALLPPKDIWGARMMLVRYPASDMVVKVNTVTTQGVKVEQAKDYSKKYLNEGRHHWDVSVGLPIKSVRELEYKTDANNIVTTGAKERQHAYGFLNIFPKAVDLSSERFLTFPHFVFGVPLAAKPLHHPFAGIGYGVYKTPIKFNIFAGVVFNRERGPRTLNAGDAATSTQLESDLRTRWVRKFMFGINFPISQITKAIKNN